MSTYNEGDLVEAVKGETVVRGRVNREQELTGDIYYVGESYRSLRNLESQGYTVTVIETAKPKLPTAFGSVIRGAYKGERVIAARIDDDHLPWRTDGEGDDVPSWLNGRELDDVEVLFDAQAVSA